MTPREAPRRRVSMRLRFWTAAETAVFRVWFWVSKQRRAAEPVQLTVATSEDPCAES